MIRFEEITNKNIWKVCMLEPFDEQKDYVAENMQSLAEAYATRNEGNNALPLAVYNDDELIGFVMIGKGTVGNENESNTIKENYSFWRFMLDMARQKEYGCLMNQKTLMQETYTVSTVLWKTEKCAAMRSLLYMNCRRAQLYDT